MGLGAARAMWDALCWLVVLPHAVMTHYAIGEGVLAAAVRDVVCCLVLRRGWLCCVLSSRALPCRYLCLSGAARLVVGAAVAGV